MEDPGTCDGVAATDAAGRVVYKSDTIHPRHGLDPKYARAYNNRGRLRYLSGDAKSAIEDFSKGAELNEPAQRDYAVLFRWMARLRLADRDRARTELSEFFGSRAWKESDAWTASLLAFAIGKMTREELFARAEGSAEADRSGHVCEARFYAGIAALGEGRDADATADFEKALATEKKSFAEYDLAQFELERLKKKR